jgi:HYR domain
MKRFSSGVRVVVASAAFLTVGLGAAPIAQAALQVDVSPGSGAPPATLGGYTMVPSPQDARPEPSTVMDAPATPTSSFSFGTDMGLQTVGSSWASSNWAGGAYAGRVYFSLGANAVTITLPSPSSAVYLYAAPNQSGPLEMEATATAQSGATVSSGPISVPENPTGDALPSGQYFGFYGTGGDTVQSITVSMVSSVVYNGLAVGDFALAGAASDDDLALSGVPSDMSVDATGPDGAPVTYAAPTAVDEDTPATASVSCSPSSGSTFAIGVTTVTCTATDADDLNSPVSQSFTVTVKGAAQQLSDLASAVRGVGPGASLAHKVAAAEAALAKGEKRKACRSLEAFRDEVRAQAGKTIPVAEARELIADARRIEAVIGCGKVTKRH